MKNITTLLLVLLSTTSFGQRSWTVSLSSGMGLGGPAASLKKQMRDQGYDQTSHYNFFGLTGSESYPDVRKSPSFLVRATREIDKHRSLYFMAGQADKAEVRGFRSTGGYTDLLGIIGSSNGLSPAVKFTLYQFMAGFQFSTASGRAKGAVGPALFMMNYCSNDDASYSSYGAKRTAFMPGATATGRLAFGKQRKAAGFELMMDLNMAPPVRMTAENKQTGFRPGKANLFSINAGLAFTIRSRPQTDKKPSARS